MPCSGLLAACEHVVAPHHQSSYSMIRIKDLDGLQAKIPSPLGS